MTVILAANYSEGRTFRVDHRFTEADTVVIFDLKDLQAIEQYEFQSILVTNGFLSKPALHELWRASIKRLRLPHRKDI